MPLNLLKLCVGAESAEDQREWSIHRLKQMRKTGEEEMLFHTTRMVPKRKQELLDGGALYWVIKGNVQLRQKILDIRPFVDDQGIRRCKLMLSSDLEATQWQPRRAFQGWRYLEQKDAPPLLSDGSSSVPPILHAELAELGLL